MNRLQYLLARVTILALLVSAVWLGSKPLIRQSVVQYIEQSTGGRVEVGTVEADFSRGQLYLKELAIADPTRPQRNLLQASEVHATLDSGAMWYRRWVIKQAQMSGVILDTPRTISGALDEPSKNLPPQSVAIPARTASAHAIPLATVETQVLVAAPAPVEKLVDQFSQMLFRREGSLPDFAQQAAEIERRWDTQLLKISENFTAQKSALSTAAEIRQVASVNPLRDGERLAEASRVVQASHQRLVQVRQLVVDFQEQARQDIAKFEQQVPPRPPTAVPPRDLSGDVISEVLFSDFGVEQVEEALAWARWFYSAIPDGESQFRPVSQLQPRVFFRGETPQPELVIEQLNFDGTGQFRGQHLEFAGELNHFTNQPQFRTQPMQVEFRAQGNQHFNVAGTFEHIHGRPTARLQVLCPDWSVPPQTLGVADTLQAQMGGSPLHLNLRLQADSEKIDGEIVLSQSAGAVHIEDLHDLGGGADMQNLLNQHLASIREYQIHLSFTGSPEEVRVTVASNLGPQLATALNNAWLRYDELFQSQNWERVRGECQTQAQQLQLRLDQRLETLQNQLDSQASALRTLSAELEQPLQQPIRR